MDRSRAEPSPPPLPLSARVFVAVIGIAGLVAIILTLRNWTPAPALRFAIYLAIALASSGMKVAIPGVSGNISVNYVFTLLCILEFNVSETLLLALAAALSQTFLHTKEAPRPAHFIFNVACISLTVLSAATVYHQPWFASTTEGSASRLTIAGIVYFLVNSLSVSAIIALSERRSVFKVWRGFFDWSFAYYLVGISLALMVHLSIQQLGWMFTLALLPLLYMIYRSYKIYLGKMEQEKSHAENMASLHLRTIEALALAIEAKDECTHDHLTRVQVYSLKTAEHLGLAPDEVMALQAAAILHDIGKLAVPDYIISKPGKLTPEEFEKMKVHTVVGATILEQVGFPYPVPPIVRSHHERWDGSGYPDGLKAEEIPIGARILGAVDCLDALATDRQYRRALPLDEAMEYVASLSGRSFDPRVVDILKRHYREFEAMARAAPRRETRLGKDIVITRGDAPAAGFQQDHSIPPGGVVEEARTFTASVAAARQEIQAVLEAAHDVSAALRPEELLSLIAERLKQVVPFDCIAFYIRQGNILRPRYVSGEGSRIFASLEIPVGQGLSGWVVENKRPIVNGNPSVEPGYLNDPTRFSLLNSALALPLSGGDQVSGVLTLYRTERDAFTRDDLRLLLAVIGRISRAIEVSIRFQKPHGGLSDELTGLGNARSLYLRLQEELGRAAEDRHEFAVMVCDLDGFHYVNARFGEFAGNELLRRVAAILSENCRESDFVARMGGDEFAVLLTGARGDVLNAKIESLDRAVRRTARDLCGEDKVGFSVGLACCPEHGADAETLLSYAEEQMYRTKRIRSASLAGSIGQVA